MNKMSETRELLLREKNALLNALAQARTDAYERVSQLRDLSEELERAEQNGYLALENEAEAYEDIADAYDMLIELICQDRVMIIKKGN